MSSSTSTKPEHYGHGVLIYIPGHDRSTEVMLKKHGGINRSKFVRQLIREFDERSTKSKMK